MEASERDQDQSSSQDEKRNAPTVSREKWKAHAINKMARGYVLIVGTERRNANFYQSGKGYETCAFDTAKKLIQEGIVVKSHDHYLGTAYKLAEGIAPPPKQAPPPPPPPDPEEDEMESLLNELEIKTDDEDGLDG